MSSFNCTPVEVKFFTDKLKAFTREATDGATEYYLEGIASSTVVDRMGDKIALEAQLQMEQAAKGLTMWLNHSYVVPEDIFGTCEDSQLQMAVDEQQGDCFDLVIRVRVNQQNDRAMKTWNSVNKGVSLGFSIGGSVLDYKWEDDTFVILGMDLFEISIVGIPANQRAMISDVVAKSLRKAQKQLIEQPLHTSITDMNTQNQAAVLIDTAESVAVLKTPVVDESPVNDEAAEEVTETVEAVPVTLAEELVALAVDTAEAIITKEIEQPEIIKEGREISQANAEKLQACLTSIKSAMEHVCSAGSAHMQNAHDIVASLLPQGFEGDPEDPEPTTEDPGAQGDSIPDDDADDNNNKSVDHPDFQASIDAAVKSAVEELNAQKSAEIVALQQTIEELKATPVGRITKATGSPISSTVDPDARRNETDTDIRNQLTRALRGA